MTSIYNPIQIHFTGQWYKSESINPTPNQEIHILPVPNKIERLFDFIGINSEITGYLIHIDASNPLIYQFKTELLEDFGIKTRWSSNKENIEEKHGSETPEKLFLTPFQEPEGYSLQIIPSGVYIQAVTLHGLFNAFQTFRQLLIGATTRNIRLNIEYLIPRIKIIDWPDLAIRGVTDDITRGQIPTVDWLKQFIKNISQYKNNYYGLYIEDLFKCSKHPQIGEGRGVFTSEDLIELDRYAKSRFVTLFPIFECLGHMENILILPEYRDLGEFPGAQCVAVSNGNIYSLFRDIISELSPCFSSKMFHMGCDEFFDFGTRPVTRINSNCGGRCCTPPSYQENL